MYSGTKMKQSGSLFEEFPRMCAFSPTLTMKTIGDSDKTIFSLPHYCKCKPGAGKTAEQAVWIDAKIIPAQKKPVVRHIHYLAQSVQNVVIKIEQSLAGQVTFFNFCLLAELS